jgi:AcrR family transcriptional regulator
MSAHRRTQTRAAIKEAALDSFLDHGYDATSLDTIADKIRLTRPAILYHYKSKEAVLRAILEPAIADIEEALGQLPARTRPSVADRRAVIEALLGVFLRHRRRMALMIRFTNHTETADIGDRVRRLNHRAALLLAGPDFEKEPVVRALVIATLAALSGVMGARLHAPLDTPVEQEALTNGLLALLQSR